MATLREGPWRWENVLSRLLVMEWKQDELCWIGGLGFIILDSREDVSDAEFLDVLVGSCVTTLRIHHGVLGWSKLMRPFKNLEKMTTALSSGMTTSCGGGLNSSRQSIFLGADQKEGCKCSARSCELFR